MCLQGGVSAGVEQETFIFDTTIFENIRVGHPSASKKAIEEAACAAGIHAKRDLETACGAGGKLLSPAEAQRIGIARGCLRIVSASAPADSLLVLDDPFSFQDPHSAAHIIAHLRHLAVLGTTVVALTQHCALCAAADIVFVLGDGKLQAKGTHEDMLQEKSCLYAKIHSISESFSVSSNGSVTRVRGSGLENYWIFAGLDKRAREAVARSFVPQNYQAGHIIYELSSFGTDRITLQPMGDDDDAASSMAYHQLCIVTRGQVELVIGSDQHVLAVYGVGQIFGPAVSLMTLEQDAHLRCSKATDVVALDTVSLSALCDKFETLQAAFDTCRQLRSELDTNDHLRQLWRGFVHLSEEELEDQVRLLLSTEVHPVGTQICHQHQEVHKLFLIVRGEVQLYASSGSPHMTQSHDSMSEYSEHSSDDSDRPVLGRGKLLGDVDLCDHSRYDNGVPKWSFSAVTKSPTVVLTLPLLGFLELRESNDRFAAFVEREITLQALQAQHRHGSNQGQQHPQQHESSPQSQSSQERKLGIGMHSSMVMSTDSTGSAIDEIEPARPSPTRKKSKSPPSPGSASNGGANNDRNGGGRTR